MKSAKLLLSALLLLVGITACYDDYTHDYEGADMGFAVAKPVSYTHLTLPTNSLV